VTGIQETLSQQLAILTRLWNIPHQASLRPSQRPFNPSIIPQMLDKLPDSGGHFAPKYSHPASNAPWKTGRTSALPMIGMAVFSPPRLTEKK